MLDGDTIRRMQELFSDKKCCRCGEPAQRFRRPHFYYCRACYPENKRRAVQHRLLLAGAGSFAVEDDSGRYR